MAYSYILVIRLGQELIKMLVICLINFIIDRVDTTVFDRVDLYESLRTLVPAMFASLMGGTNVYNIIVIYYDVQASKSISSNSL